MIIEIIQPKEALIRKFRLFCDNFNYTKNISMDFFLFKSLEI